MRFLRRGFAGLFLIGLTLGLLALAGNSLRTAVNERMNREPRDFAQRERVISVDVVQVSPQQVMPELTVFGEIASRRTIDLRAPASGVVDRIGPNLVEGGTVQAGELLFQLDRTDAQAALDRVRADVQDAVANQADADRALALAVDELSAAQAQAELRRLALERASDLLGRGAGTAAAVETAQLAASTADAAVLTRRQSLAAAQTRLDQTATALDRARLALESAERSLSDTEVLASFDGTLASVTLAPGSRVNGTEIVARLIDPAAIEVSFRVSTSQYARLLDGGGDLLNAPVEVALDVGDIRLAARGSITRESAVVGEGQTGRLLFADLDAAPGFRPGDFVTVTVTEPPLDNVALLPASAVGAEGTVLVLGPDDRLEAIAVLVLRRLGDEVLINAAGLDGRSIVARRTPLLGAGIKVAPTGRGNSETAQAAGEGKADAADMIRLDPDRRARLVAFVTVSRMPDEAKSRILSQLDQDEVPAETVTRLESRMGG